MSTAATPTTPASASELSEMLGELGSRTLERLLATRATRREVADAIAAIEDPDALGAAPATPREAQVRSILEELMLEGLDEREQDIIRT